MPLAPYDTVETALNMARVRINDAIQSLAGDILTDNQPFTQQFANNAWRKLQQVLVDFGFVALEDEFIISALPASTSLDAGTQVLLGWTGYNPGSGLTTSPALPQNLISPLELWERITGSGANYTSMDQVYNGLPAVGQGLWNRLWEWRSEMIYMPGATGTTDLRIRFAKFFPDFVTTGGTLWQNQPITIMRSASALAWFMCSEVARARGDVDANYFDQAGSTEARMIFDRDPAPAVLTAKPADLGAMRGRNTTIPPLQPPAQGVV